jgi:MvaI/BcnI restriction endonuclease family
MAGSERARYERFGMPSLTHLLSPIQVSFSTLDALLARMHDLGAQQVLCKELAENDNSKQQIYLGGNFEVLRLLPFQEVRTDASLKRPNFKAKLDLRWISSDGTVARAPWAQLILYPDYPEVRLSGFLRDCPLAPSVLMQPIPQDRRRHNNIGDGRVMFFGITGNRATLVYVAAARSAVAAAFDRRRSRNEFEFIGMFWRVTTPAELNPRNALLAKLTAIHCAGWHDSSKLNREGLPMPYTARNGAGYTLEALFGIRPNGDAAPDFMGWELKAFRSGKVTLMTPEPDTGFYGTNGVRAFVGKYGRAAPNDVMYFTGTHRANMRCTSSGQLLTIRGFDVHTLKIVDVAGGIDLLDTKNQLAAGWSFARLIEHWGHKHAFAAYVPYATRNAIPQYRFNSPVLLGEGTDFTLYLAAMMAGHVIYDPASKIVAASTLRSRVKARSQFRIPIRYLSMLYRKFQPIALLCD